MAKKKSVRTTVTATARAKKVYPLFGSSKSDSQYVNALLSEDEALNLAKNILQAVRESDELTIRLDRKAAKKTKLHSVTVTYEKRKKK